MTQPTQEVLLRKFAIEQSIRALPQATRENILAFAEEIYTFCAKGLPQPKVPAPSDPNSPDLPF